MPKYKLHYFNVRGRAELIRLMLHQVQVEFEDKRYSFEDWEKVKDDEKLFPFKKMPVLEIDEDTFIPQSLAIARFVANEHGLGGKNNKEKAQCDSVLYAVQDLFDHFYNWIHMTRDEYIKEQNKQDFFETVLPRNLKQIEKIHLRNNGGKGYLVGDELTWVDIFLIALADMWGEEHFKCVPSLQKLLEKVRDLPNIKKYLEARPQTVF